MKPAGRLIVSAKVVGYSPACTLKSFESLQELLSKCGENVKVLVRVTDENGNPVQGAEVKVTPYPVSGYTNASGEVCFTLPPGTYVITATKENYLPGANISITISKDLVEKLAREFMESAVNETKKAINETRKTINETLDVLCVSVSPKFVNVNEPQSVTVKVTFNGEPVSDAYVKVEKAGVVVAQGYTDTNGRYVYRGPFKMGVYFVSASKTGYRTGFAAFAVGKVPVFVHVLPYVGPNLKEAVKVAAGPVEKVVMNFGKEAKNVVLEIKKLEKLPEKVEKPKGVVYAVLEINATNESAVKSATIYFNVSKNWLAEHGFSKNSIVLERYHSGWIALLTKVVGEDSNNVYYSATTSGFSVYAITAVQSSTLNPTPTSTTTSTSTPTPVQTTSKKSPGFEAVIAILALTFVVLKKKF